MEPASRPLRLGAVVVAGGGAARMGGADKASLELDGVSLLERALTAVAAASAVVVVGDPVPTSLPVRWTREEPPGGGPAAGLLAGLDALPADVELAVVLAVDMPRVHAATVARLTWAVEGSAADGAVLVDAGGRRQPLCAVYRRDALQRVRPAAGESTSGLPVHRLVSGLELAEVPAEGREAADVDTWEDLDRLGRS